VTSATSPVESRLERTARRWLFSPLMIAARIAVVAMCVATLADIVGRHVFGLPIPGIIELAELALVWAAFTGIAAAFRTGTHVSVELIELLLSRRGLAVIELMTTLIVVMLMAWLAWLGIAEFLETMDWDDRTTDLGILYTWYWAAVVVGYSGSVVLLIVRVPALWRRHRSAE